MNLLKSAVIGRRYSNEESVMVKLVLRGNSTFDTFSHVHNDFWKVNNLQRL